jgi:hypothetical protein
MTAESVAATTSWGTARNWVIALLLGLATVHCVQSIFVVNVSFIDVRSYDNGTEKMPFQGRIAMMPIGRWASGNHAMKRAAAWLKVRIFQDRTLIAEPYTPEKVAFMIVGLCATLLTTGFLARIGWRLVPQAWWLPPAFFLYMLYTTYAARCDAEFWYPYDLPHFALFGVAAVCIFRGLWPAAFFLFLVDVPMRETSVYLVALLLAVGYARRKWQVLPWAAVMFVLWVLVRGSISHHFAGNPTDVRIHWEHWYYAFHNPYKWAQFASPFGFLLIPFCWGWKYLTRDERFFVFGALPGIAVTAAFGVPIETRIYDEWLAPMAVLLSLQATRAIAHKSSQATLASADTRLTALSEA